MVSNCALLETSSQELELVIIFISILKGGKCFESDRRNFIKETEQKPTLPAVQTLLQFLLTVWASKTESLF